MAFTSTAAYSGLDVGGTTIMRGLTAGHKLVGQIQTYDSPSSFGADEAIAAFSAILLDSEEQANKHGLSLKAHGIAMPGPFDYTGGISWMEHKFEGIHGADIKTPLAALGKPVYFVNDADAFALGVQYHEYPRESRVLGVTLGTGLGSGFIIGGQIVPPDSDEAPNGGEIWNMPYGDTGLEDAVFARGLFGTFARAGGQPGTSTKDIMDLARNGDAAARPAVAAFGQELGAGLAVASLVFKPTIIVLGGQVSKGFDTFGSHMKRAFRAKAGKTLGEMRFCLTRLDVGQAAIHGAARYAAQLDSA